MNATIVNDGERALFYKNGVLARVLGPGRHRLWAYFAQARTDVITPQMPVTALVPGLDAMVSAQDAEIIEVAAGQAALVSKRGRPVRVVGPGEWVLWQIDGAVVADIVDLRPLRAAIPNRFWALADAFVRTVVVQPWMRAVVLDNGREVEVLKQGVYALSTYDRDLQVQLLDLREQELQVSGQELLTADKVSLRLNVMCKYSIVDASLAVTSTAGLHDALYAEVQLGVRNAVAGVSVDALIEQRVELSTEMVAAVQARAEAWGVRVARLDIKDVVLPGDMKALLNQVIEAEKRAAAQNILRREETAATRSLANTARLLENNPVLLRLKEIELYKDMAERVDTLSVVVSPSDLKHELRLDGRG